MSPPHMAAGRVDCRVFGVRHEVLQVLCTEAHQLKPPISQHSILVTKYPRQTSCKEGRFTLAHSLGRFSLQSVNHRRST